MIELTTHKKQTHMKLKPTMKSSFARNLGALALFGIASTASANAAIVTTELTGAIADGVTAAEGLIGAGFALLAVFIIAKAIRKGASRIG